MLRRQPHSLKLLNKATNSELAKLSGLSKSYLSQIKNGKRPPSNKLLGILANYQKPEKVNRDYFAQFLESRKANGGKSMYDCILYRKIIQIHCECRLLTYFKSCY
ncbi:helix-turn-helix domain-containing protein [Chloroflexota bacterium]